MTFGRLALASLLYYRRTNAAVMLGIATAVAVLAGSLVVGDSVRDSLRAIATSRLGRTDVVVAAELPFTESLTDRMAGAGSAAAPILSLTGVVRHEPSSARAGDVRVYGVDDRFFAFHGVPVEQLQSSEALIGPELAEELGASAGDAIVLRVPRPTDIPLDSLHGRRDESGRSIRLTVRAVLPRDRMGSFSLTSGQAPVRTVFVALRRLQKDLGLAGRVNTLLISGNPPPTVDRVRQVLNSTATAADVGLKTETLPSSNSVVVESTAGLLPDEMAVRIEGIAKQAGRTTTPMLTWLANRITVGDRSVPYSLVTAVAPGSTGNAALDEALERTSAGPPPLVLNEWTARELAAKAGAAVELEYYRWADEGRLVTERRQFHVAGVVPMTGIAIDQRLAPDYPGITSARNFADWDPPFPIDLTRVREQDEDYWDRYRTAPKAFIPLEAGQSIWRTRHGQLTAIRIGGADPIALDRAADASSISVVDVRTQNVSSAAGATDFGAYFSYFSFFLMVSALLLAALFFRLSIEQRIAHIGVLRAAGFPMESVRRLFLLEGALVTLAGAAAGVVLAIGWASLMVFGLTTWWIDAVGTRELTVHVRAIPLIGSALAVAVAAALSIALSIRALGRSSPRSQLAGTLPASVPGVTVRRWIGPALFVAAGLFAVASLAGVVAPAGGFFGAGALVLAGGLASLWSALRRRPASAGAAATSVSALSLRNAAWRPGRSMTAAGLVAAAVFLLVSVDSFRKTADAAGSITSGTGGFALIAESQLPIVHDLRTPEGREAVGLPAREGDPALAGIDIHALRLRPGEDTSCLNLYQPKQPRVLGIPSRLVDEKRFRFARVIDSADGDARENPWKLLDAPDTSKGIPAIVDQTSLQYVLHASVGDVITIDAHTSRPLNLLIVASLDDSVLQAEILIGERVFEKAFPEVSGYRMFFVTVENPSTARVATVSQTLEEALEPFGFDAQSASAKLESFHRVENTYLSTFQALGGLGLVLGCVGLIAVIARNVLERRRELALLGAAGFAGRDLQRLVATEHLALVGIGVTIGLLAAAVAIAPVLAARGGAVPWHALVWLVPVSIAGFLASFGTTRGLRRLALVDSLRNE